MVQKFPTSTLTSSTRIQLKYHQEKKSHQTESSEASVHNDNIHYVTQLTNNPTSNNEETAIEKGSKIKYNVEDKDVSQIEIDTSTTVALVSSNRNLELEIKELLHQISQLEKKYELVVNSHNAIKQQNVYLETELVTLKEKCNIVNEQQLQKNKILHEYKSLISSLTEERNNLLEQLEFTKALLTSKETENSFLNNENIDLQKKVEATDLRLQQLSDGQKDESTEGYIKSIDVQQNESLLHKISQLEQQLKSVQKECDQINSHYEHYISELNEELKSVMKRNEDLMKESVNLSTRENNLINQISNMEIQLQNFRSNQVTNKVLEDENLMQVQENLKATQEKLHNMEVLYDEIQQKLHSSEIKVKQLEIKNDDTKIDDDTMCISKLHADITNDKIAAQRATEQNRKLKSDLEELEEAFVKMSKDKLELTEKLEAEKFLNRELTIKLAENVEVAKDVQVKLRAKDEEMIRIQNNYRELETKIELYSHSQFNNGNSSLQVKDQERILADDRLNKVEMTSQKNRQSHCYLTAPEDKSNVQDEIGNLMAKEDAMLKLQDRFLKIMTEVADLSDEKHRLEHIIMQLQNETDTICEYVALYQQQRSLLKHRDEERSAQIKIFQSECERMRTQLNQLNEIIVKIMNDEELVSYFKKEMKHNDISDALNILNNMKTNLLIDSTNQYAEMHNFYPCACCSGNIIDL